jgi:hypothetical protein
MGGAVAYESLHAGLTDTQPMLRSRLTILAREDCLGDLDNDLKLSQGLSRRGGGAR